MSFTNYLDAAIANHVFGGVIYTPPADLYLALSTSAPTQYPGGGGHNFTEVTGPGYARAMSVNNGGDWALAAVQPASGALVTNVAGITLPASTGPWSAGATIAWAGLFDAALAGNLLAFGPILPTLIIPGAGYIVPVPAGAITLAII